MATFWCGWSALRDRFFCGIEILNEMTDLVDRRARFGHPRGSRLKHVDLSIPDLQIAGDTGFDETIGHEFGICHQHFVGADVNERGR